MQFDTNYTRLVNGVRVLTVPMNGVESVTTLVLVRTGSRNEPDERGGISHILEHMMLKASKKYATQKILASAIDSMGAHHNAFTGKEYTGYYITAAARHLKTSLDILGDVMTNPLLLEKNLETELGVIIEEYNMYKEMHMRQSFIEFEKLMFEGSTMEKSILGLPETIISTTVDHLRAYIDLWYKGGNILVVVAGKIPDTAELTRLIEENFGVTAAGEIKPYIEKTTFGSVMNRHHKRKTEQAHFAIGVPAISMHDPRRYALQVAEVVLGGPMSSRLFDEIREKRGLAYYVHADIQDYFDAGYFSVRAGVKLAKLSEALKVVKHELFTLADTFTEEELRLGKDYILGKFPLGLEGSMDVAQYLGMHALLTDKIRQPSEAEQAILKVTTEDVKNILNEIIQEKSLRTSVIGPKDK